MSAFVLPSTPTIEIHLADDEFSHQLEVEIQPLKSPFSPKFPSPMAYEDSDSDDFRPKHLQLPPTVSPLRETHRLPKPQAASLPTDKKGIDQERFAQLLKSSRERAAMKHGRKSSVELRKQVTLKEHTTKALERRALFLSKIQSAPTPEAAESPVTPPESPAIFHFTLPSPGMQSPLAMFGKLANESEKSCNTVDFPRDSSAPEARKVWVEEVDFKARVRSNSLLRASSAAASLDLAVSARSGQRKARGSPSHALPSLDQITARLATKVTSQANTAASDVAPSVSAVGGLKLLPKSLGVARQRPGQPGHRRTPSSPLATSPVFTFNVKDEDEKTPELESESAPAPVAEKPAVPSRLPQFLQKRISRECIEIPTPAPVAPTPTPGTPTIEITEPEPSPVQKRSSQTLPSGSIVIQSSPVNRRRPSCAPPPQLPPSQPFTAHLTPTRLSYSKAGAAPVSSETRKQRGLDMVEKLRRRSSAPAALPPVVDKSKQHPVLSLKGGF
ncbi:hypothetical protein FRB90_011569 [Tulasnella sp. 427]|nr:hypothetical protein FRB90_011569 [Tulasnella sp. 427]